MIRSIAFAALLASTALSGCASAPPEYVEEDYGPPISQEDAEARAEPYFKKLLKDPYSAVFEWQPIRKGYWQSAPIFGGRSAPGYVLEGTVNARNSYGGYTGAKRVVIVFNYGAVLKAEMESESGAMLPIE